jgi:hypothetical protein
MRTFLAAIVLSIGSYGGELQSSKYTYQMKRAIEDDRRY